MPTTAQQLMINLSTQKLRDYLRRLPGCVLLADLQELSGNTKDYSLSALTGTVTGATQGTPGNQRTRDFAYSFDGVNDDVSFGNASALNFERTQAFSGMVLAQRITSADDSGALIGKMLSTGVLAGWRLALEHALNSYKLNLALISNAGTSNLIRVDSTTQFTSLTDWNLFGFSYDGSSTEAGIKLYRNGLRETPVNTGGTLSATIQGAGEVRIGAFGEAAAAAPSDSEVNYEYS